MRVKFYGVRGSIASPGNDTAGYGGNTSCVLLELDDHSLIVFDAGTGIRKLGNHLLERNAFKTGQKPDIHLFFSHFHWDHIQGLPFFKPAYKSHQKIYLAAAHLDDVKDPLAVLDQMLDPHFPVPSDQLQASVVSLKADANGKFHVGAGQISTCPLNHPGGGAAYRVDTPEGSFAYVTDNELEPPNQPKTTWPEWREFLKDVDCLIHDAMYLDDERKDHLGWGHSTVEQAQQLAVDAGVKTLVLFHHDPERKDGQLDHILHISVSWMENENPSCKVYMAKEGDEYAISKTSVVLLPPNTVE
jgi:phosphoribosyl 1,2-cyclic phosphodiesterase